METQYLHAGGESINKFALKFQKLIPEKGNHSFSPLSIFNAIGLLFTGADGSTADQIQNLIELKSFNADQILEIYGALVQSLESFSEECQLYFVNRIYGQKDFEFSEKYLETTKKYLHVDVEAADFKQSFEEERRKINLWVEEVTRNMIKDLLPVNSLNAETVAVLVNALYFKGTWVHQFMPTQTYKEDFYTSSGEAVKVDMMVQYDKSYVIGAMQSLNSSFIHLPYRGDDTYMCIILPKPLQKQPNSQLTGTMTLDQVISQLDITNLKQILDYQNLRMEVADVYLPRFTVEYSIQLSQPLKQLGMQDAFDQPTASFGNMISKDESRGFCVSEGFHKTKVIVDESGTEAAAATAFVMKGCSSMPPKPFVFKVDQPFLFFIIHHESSSVLFMGRVDNPVAAA